MRFTGLLVLAFLALIAFSGLVSAQPIDVDVRKIYATRTGDTVDPKLSDLKKHFARFGPFKSFQALGESSLKFAEKGDTQTVKLDSGDTLTLIYRGQSKGYIKLRFKLGQMQMNVRLKDGGLFFHTGVPWKEGQLVLAIEAKSGQQKRKPK